MTKAAVKGRELEHFTAKQGPEETRRKAKERARATGSASFMGKTFAELNEAEKDELLKTLAIAAGLIVE